MSPSSWHQIVGDGHTFSRKGQLVCWFSSIIIRRYPPNHRTSFHATTWIWTRRNSCTRPRAKWTRIQICWTMSVQTAVSEKVFNKQAIIWAWRRDIYGYLFFFEQVVRGELVACAHTSAHWSQRNHRKHWHYYGAPPVNRNGRPPWQPVNSFNSNWLLFCFSFTSIGRSVICDITFLIILICHFLLIHLGMYSF